MPHLTLKPPKSMSRRKHANWRYYQIISAAKWSFTSPRHIITADNGTVPSDDIKDCCVVVILCKFDFGLGGGANYSIAPPPPETSWGGGHGPVGPPPLDPPLRCSKSTSQKSDVRCVHIHKSSVRAHVPTPFARWYLRGRSFIADHSALLVVPAVAEGKVEIGSPGSSLTSSLSSAFTASGSSGKWREWSLTKQATLWSD